VLRHDTFTPVFTPMKVTIENHRDLLRLRWTCPNTGKRRILSLGIADSNTGRGKAQSVKADIENDVRYGYYDPTLVKYQPQKKRQELTGISTVELFRQFTQHQQKHKGLNKESIDTRYKYLGKMLEKHLSVRAADIDRHKAEAFALVCRETLKPDTAKQRIWLLESAWEFGKHRFQLPALNPWDGIADRFESVPSRPNPAFSKDEVKKIIEGFRNSPHYSNYLDYVIFRLTMACRPQEVRDLVWRDIASDFSTVWFASNKTKKGRVVHLNSSIAKMLSNRYQKVNPKPDDLIFTSREGLPVDNGNFRRLWRIVLGEVGVDYRKPYTTRKTSVRNALLNGENYIEVAAAAGHDPHTMHKFYSDAIETRSVFVAIE
jgi:integrase